MRSAGHVNVRHELGVESNKPAESHGMAARVSLNRQCE